MKVSDLIDDFDNQRENFYGLYYWFRHIDELEGIARGFADKLNFLVEEEIINKNITEVKFENKLAYSGVLYDEIGFFSEKSKRFLGKIIPRSAHNETYDKCVILLTYSGGMDKTLVFENWKDFEASVKEDFELLLDLRASLYLRERKE